MNYDDTAAALRAEIERLERERGADAAFPVTFLLLQAQSAVLKARDALDRMEARKDAGSMSSFDLDALVDATMAADHEPWTMPPCDNPDCPVGCPDSHCAPYHLLDEVAARAALVSGDSKCICLGDGLMGMACAAERHSRYEAVATKPCARCGGSGVIQGRPASSETDTSEEMALAWEMARYPCPECRK